MTVHKFTLAAALGFASAFTLSCSEKCGENKYDPKKQFCAENAVYDKCGGEEYNPAEKICMDGKIAQKCGDKGYDSAAQFCSGDKIYEKCGGEEYSPETQVCTDGKIVYQCGDKKYKPETHFCDSRDNKLYKHVKINNQIWMAENLNYAADSSKCYGEGRKIIIGWNDDDDGDYESGGKPIYANMTVAEIQANCVKYGRLYDWNTAMKVCPKGWHLPTNMEWDELSHYADGTLGTDNTKSPYKSNTAGKYLKAKKDWGTGSGNDKFGFTALPGGFGSSDDNIDYFNGVGKSGYWWSASEYDDKNAYSSNMSYVYDQYDFYYYNKTSSLRSIRCVKD